MPATTYPHIEISPEGRPIISGTRTKVIKIVLERLAYHWDADEIQRQHPQLTLAQIYSALAYYHDHQTDLDREIDEGLREAESIKESLGESAVRRKLRALGHLR